MPWWPADQWAAMRAGRDCPLCADARQPTNDHSDLVTELSTSVVRLSRNQTHAGYSIVILNRHAAELHELEPAERAAFVEDVARVGAALSALFDPVKLDALVLGHLCPHLHCHVYPQYAHDDPSAQVNVQEGTVRLSPEAQRGRVAALRARLAD